MDQSESQRLRHVSSNARHAWRNVSGAPAVVLVITTKKLGQFFQEIGRPQTSTPLSVTPEDLERFAAITARYGYWNASLKNAPGRDTSKYVNQAIY